MVILFLAGFVRLSVCARVAPKTDFCYSDFPLLELDYSRYKAFDCVAIVVFVVIVDSCDDDDDADAV